MPTTFSISYSVAFSVANPLLISIAVKYGWAFRPAPRYAMEPPRKVDKSSGVPGSMSRKKA